MLGMKDSGAEWIGQIPVNWDIVPFYTLLDNRQDALIDGPFGSDMKNEEYVDEGVPVIQLGSIREQRMDFSKMHYITEEKADSLSRHNAFPENIVIAKMMPAGKACEVPNIYSRYVVSADVARAYISDKYTRKFSVLALNSYATTQAEIESQGSTRARINLKKIRHILISRPKSHNELKRLVLYLEKKCSEIDSLTADIQSQIETLEEYKKSVITEAVTKGLNPDVELKDSGIEWIGEIPSDWTLCKIKHVCSLIGSGTTPTSGSPDFYDGGEINWIQSGDIYGKSHINDVTTLITKKALMSLPALKVYSAPFIVIAMYGGSVGNTAISEISACTNQACCCLKTNDSTLLKYLYYWIEICKHDFLYLAEGGGQPNISQNKIKNQYFVKPSVEIQERIVNFLDGKCAEIESIISEKKEQLSTLAEYKKSLIYEYVTGKKEVAEA